MISFTQLVSNPVRNDNKPVFEKNINHKYTFTRNQGPLSFISNGMIRRGLTLIELLISIAIIGVVVVIVGSIFINTSQFGSDEQLRIDVGESASRVLGPLDAILREGKEIQSSAVIGGTTYTSDHDTIVFTLPALDAGGATIAGVSDVAVITLDTTNANNYILRLIVDPASGTFRQRQNGLAVDHVKDLYIRYTAGTPVAAQAITLTARITKELRNRTFTRTNILYAVFRNHP